MAFQLVYSSVPAGLVAGRSGFCTVARHREIREALVSSIEGFSNIFDRGAQAAEDKLGTPVIYAFRKIKVGTSEYHVLSRIREAGSDYSGRGNHIAHSFVLEPGELESLTITPAEALLALEDEGHWRDSWTGGDPRYFKDGDKVPLADLGEYVSLRQGEGAKHWEKSTGAPANAAQPWEAANAERTYLVFDGGESPRSILQHIGESELVRDPERRNPAALWSVPFTTHLQTSDDRSAFQWSVVKAGSPPHAGLGRGKGRVIEVRSGLEPPVGDLADVAAGVAVEAREKAGSGISPDKGAAKIASVAVPATLGGAGAASNRPAAENFDQVDYDDKIESMIGGGEGKKRGGLLTPFRLGVAAVMAMLVLGILWPKLKGDPEKTRLEALRVEMNTLLVASKWDAARELVDKHEPPEDFREVSLVEPVAALKAAESFNNIHASIHTMPSPQVYFDGVGESVDWKNRNNLSKMRSDAEKQVKTWLDFRAQLSESWGGVKRFAVSLENEYVDPAELGSPLEGALGKLKNEFPPAGENGENPHAAAGKANGQLEKARVLVTEFAGLVNEAGNLKPEDEGKALKAKAEENLKDRAYKLLDEVNAPQKEYQSLLPLGKEPMDVVSRTITLFDPTNYRKKEPEKPDPKDMTSVEKPSGEEKEDPEKVAVKPAVIDLPPTILVKWDVEHDYQIDLGKEFGGIDLSEVVDSTSHPNLEPAPDSKWTPIIDGKIRPDIAGKPIFKSEFNGTNVKLDGLPILVSGGGLDTGFVIRFSAKAKGDPTAKELKVPPSYQVVFCEPSPTEPLLHLPIGNSLERGKGEDGAMVVQLSGEARKALEKIVPGDLILGNADLVMKVVFNGSVDPTLSPPAKSEGRFPFGDVKLPMPSGSGIEQRKKEIEGEITRLTAIQGQGAVFAGGFEKAGTAKNLFQGIVQVDQERYKVGKEEKIRPKRRQLVSPWNLEEQKGTCPAFVDYITGVVGKVIEDDEIHFDLGESAPQSDLGVLEVFHSRRAGWTQGEFDGVRTALTELRTHAESRLKNIEKNADKFPARTNGESIENYFRRLRDRERKINADRFFENWVKLFNEKSLKQIWPYFKESGVENFGAEVTAKTKHLESELKNLKNQQERAKDFAEAPLAELGTWYLDLEIPGPPNPASPTPQKEVIRLVSFTKGGAAQAKPTGETSPEDGTETLNSSLPAEAINNGGGN